MDAAILSIGTELTRGELVDSNTAWLSERLTELGVEVIEQSSVPDDLAVIVATMQRLASRAALVVCTGGLGPTSDDLTTEAAAQALGVGLERHEAVLQKIRRRFETHRMPMPALNQKQADLPEGSQILSNDVGTAPGFRVALQDAQLYALPGVPREMKAMYLAHIEPELRAQVQVATHQIHLRCFGLTESGLAQKLSEIEARYPNVTLAYRAGFPEIEVKVLAHEASLELSKQMAEQVAAQIRERLGEVCFGGREESFAAVVGDALRASGKTIAIAESCTGGLIGSLLTRVPGSSDYLLLDALTYANSAKQAVLGVPAETLERHGAVSEPTAIAMAEGALAISGADYAVSTTGIAGPAGGSEAKPVGQICFGFAQKGGASQSETRQLSGRRDQIQTLGSYLALRMLRRAALGLPVVKA